MVIWKAVTMILKGIFHFFSKIAIFSLIFSLSNSVFACTNFRVLAKDNTIIIARSVEFSNALNSNIKTVQRGTPFNSVAPGGKPGMTWQAKYGYVAVDALNAALVLDGMNEKGLSFEYLFLPSETQYQTIPPDKVSQALPYNLFGDWILSNFDTVENVRAALPKILVFSQRITELGNQVFPFHASITDLLGNAIVVEFVDGKMNVYDNKLGVLTNSPAFDWHLVNLRNFMDLSPYAPNPVVTEGVTFVSATQSAGMIGLPGDYSSPSRFVKTALQLATAVPADNGKQAVNIAEHLLNTVDLTKGIVRAKQGEGSDLMEWTQWAVIKDITNKVLYFRSYEDMTLRSIALGKLDFSEKGSVLKMPLTNPAPAIIDVSDQFSASKAGQNAPPAPDNSKNLPSPANAPANNNAVAPANAPAATVTPTVVPPSPQVIEVVPTPPAVTAVPLPPPPVTAPAAPVPVVVVPGS